MKNQSLQDQLLSTGLSSNTKAKQVRAEKRKQSKQQKNKVEIVDVAKQSLQETKAKQIEKDRLLNEQRNQEAEKKQLAYQIIQLINLNKLEKDDEGVAYNFTDENKVKTIYIGEELRNKIIAGRMAIVKAGKSYEVVPVDIAEKIQLRDQQAVIVLFPENNNSAEDDEYEGYEIPDDLMW